MAADDVVGSASVEITPEFDAFERALREGVEGGLERSRAQLKKLDAEFKAVSRSVDGLGKQIRNDLSFDPQLKQVNLLGKSVSKLSREVRNLSIQVSAELTRNVSVLKREFDDAATRATRMTKAIKAAVDESKKLKTISIDFKTTDTVTAIRSLKTETRAVRTESTALKTSLDAVGKTITLDISKIKDLRGELAGAAAQARALQNALSGLAAGDISLLASGLASSSSNAQRLRSDLAGVADEAARARKQTDGLRGGGTDRAFGGRSGGSGAGGAAGAAGRRGGGLGLGLLAAASQAKRLREEEQDIKAAAAKIAREGGAEPGPTPGAPESPRGPGAGPRVDPSDVRILKQFNDEMERTSAISKRFLRPALEFQIIDVPEITRETVALRELTDALNALGGPTNLSSDRLEQARLQAREYVATLEALRDELRGEDVASGDLVATLDNQIKAGYRAADAILGLKDSEDVAARSAELLAGIEGLLAERADKLGRASRDAAEDTRSFGSATDDAAGGTKRLSDDSGALLINFEKLGGLFNSVFGRNKNVAELAADVEKTQVAMREVAAAAEAARNPIDGVTAAATRLDDELEGRSLNPALNRTAEALRRVHAETAGFEGAFSGITGGVSETDHQLGLLMNRLNLIEVEIDDFRDSIDGALLGIGDDLLSGFSEDEVTAPFRALQESLERVHEEINAVINDFNDIEDALSRIDLELNDVDQNVTDFAYDLLRSTREVDDSFESLLEDVTQLAEEIERENYTRPFEDFRDAVEEARVAVSYLAREQSQLTDREGRRSPDFQPDLRTERGSRPLAVSRQLLERPPQEGLTLPDVARIREIHDELSRIDRDLVQIGGDAGEALGDLDENLRGHAVDDVFEALTHDIDSLMNRTEELRTGFGLLGDEVDLINALDLGDPLIRSMTRLGAATSDAEVALVKLVERSGTPLDSTLIDEAINGLRRFSQQLAATRNDADVNGLVPLQRLAGGFEEIRGAADRFGGELAHLRDAASQSTGQLDVFGNEIGDVDEQLGRLIPEANKVIRLIDQISAKSERAFGVNFLAPTANAVEEALSKAGDVLDRLGALEADDVEGSLRRQVQAANELAGRYTQQLDIVQQINRALNTAGGGAADRTPSVFGQAEQVQAHNEGVDLSRQNASVTEANRILAELDALTNDVAGSFEAMRESASRVEDELEGRSLNPAMARLGEIIRGVHAEAAGFEGQLNASSAGVAAASDKVRVLRNEFIDLEEVMRGLQTGGIGDVIQRQLNAITIDRVTNEFVVFFDTLNTRINETYSAVQTFRRSVRDLGEEFAYVAAAGDGLSLNLSQLWRTFYELRNLFHQGVSDKFITDIANISQSISDLEVGATDIQIIDEADVARVVAMRDELASLGVALVGIGQRAGETLSVLHGFSGDLDQISVAAKVFRYLENTMESLQLSIEHVGFEAESALGALAADGDETSAAMFALGEVFGSVEVELVRLTNRVFQFDSSVDDTLEGTRALIGLLRRLRDGLTELPGALDGVDAVGIYRLADQFKTLRTEASSFGVAALAALQEVGDAYNRHMLGPGAFAEMIQASNRALDETRPKALALLEVMDRLAASSERWFHGISFLGPSLNDFEAALIRAENAANTLTHAGMVEGRGLTQQLQEEIRLADELNGRRSAQLDIIEQINRELLRSSTVSAPDEALQARSIGGLQTASQQNTAAALERQNAVTREANRLLGDLDAALAENAAAAEQFGRAIHEASAEFDENSLNPELVRATQLVRTFLDDLGQGTASAAQFGQQIGLLSVVLAHLSDEFEGEATVARLPLDDEFQAVILAVHELLNLAGLLRGRLDSFHVGPLDEELNRIQLTLEEIVTDADDVVDGLVRSDTSLSALHNLDEVLSDIDADLRAVATGRFLERAFDEMPGIVESAAAVNREIARLTNQLDTADRELEGIIASANEAFDGLNTEDALDELSRIDGAAANVRRNLDDIREERLGSLEVETLEVGLAHILDQLSDLTDRLNTLNTVGTFLEFNVALRELAYELQQVTREAVFFLAQGLSGEALNRAVNGVRELETAIEGISTERLGQFDTELGRLNQAAYEAGVTLEGLRYHGEPTLREISEVIRAVEELQTALTIVSRGISDFEVRLALSGDFSEEIHSIDNSLFRLGHSAERLRVEFGEPFHFSFVDQLDGIQSRLVAILDLGRSLSQTLDLGDIRAFREVEAALGGIGRELLSLSADVGGTFANELSDTFDPTFVQSFGEAIYFVERQVAGLRTTLSSGPLTLMADSSDSISRLGEELLRVGPAFGVVEMRLVRLEARGLSATQEIENLTNELGILIYALDNARSAIDFSLASGVELDHIFSNLTGHLGDAREAFRSLTDQGLTVAGRELGQFGAQVTKTLRTLDVASAQVEGLFGANILAPNDDQILTTLRAASSAIAEIGRAESEVDLEGSLRAQVEEADRLAGRLHDVSDILGRIDSVLPRTTGAQLALPSGAAPRSFDSMREERDLINVENLRRQNEVLAEGVSLLDRIDEALNGGSTAAERFGNAIHEASAEFDERSLNPELELAVVQLQFLYQQFLLGSIAADRFGEKIATAAIQVSRLAAEQKELSRLLEVGRGNGSAVTTRSVSGSARALSDRLQPVATQSLQLDPFAHPEEIIASGEALRGIHNQLGLIAEDAAALTKLFTKENPLNAALERTLELLREVRVEADDAAAAVALFGQRVFETDTDLAAMEELLRGINEQLASFYGNHPTRAVLEIVGFTDGMKALNTATSEEVGALEKMLRSTRTGTNAFTQLGAAGKDAVADINASLDLTGKKIVSFSDQAGGSRTFLQGRGGQLTNPALAQSQVDEAQAKFLNSFSDKKDPGKAKADLADLLSDTEKLVSALRRARVEASAFRFTTDAPHLDAEVDAATKFRRDAQDFAAQLESDLTSLALKLDELDATTLDESLRDVQSLLEKIYDLDQDIIHQALELRFPSDDLYEIELLTSELYDLLEEFQNNEIVGVRDIERMNELVTEARDLADNLRSADLSGVVSDDLVRKLGLVDFDQVADEAARLTEEIVGLESQIEQLPDHALDQMREALEEVTAAANETARQASFLFDDVLDQRIPVEQLVRLQQEIVSIGDSMRKADHEVDEFIDEMRTVNHAVSEVELELFGNELNRVDSELVQARSSFKDTVALLRDMAAKTPAASDALRRLGLEIKGADDELETKSLNPSLRKLVGLLKAVTVTPIEKLTKAFREANKASTALATLPGGAGAGGGGGLAKAKKEADGLDESFKKVDKSSRNVKDRLRNLIQLGAAGFGFQQVGKFLLDALNETRDLAEAINKVDVVFGNASASVKEFAQSAVTTIGQSQKQTLNAVGTFGNLFTSLGVNKDLAAELSLNMTKLGSDVASFANIPIDDALEKFRSGLSGEFEPLKSLGIAINEVALEQEALQLGFVKTGDTLDPTIKALAVYNLILKNTSNAQGDFARTSQSLANQQRVLSAQFEEAKLQIGAELLPVALQLVKVLRDNIPAFKEIAITVARFAAVLVTSLIPAMTGTLGLLKLITKALDAIGPAGVTALVAFAGFSKLRGILGGTSRDFDRLRAASTNFTKLNTVDPAQFGFVANQRAKLESFSAARKATAAEAQASASAIARFSASIEGTALAGSVGPRLEGLQKGFQKSAASATSAARATSALSKTLGGISSALPIIGAAFSFLAVAQGVYEEKVAKQAALSLESAAAITEDNKALLAQKKILDSSNVTFGKSVKQQALDFLAKDAKDNGGEVTLALGKIGKKIKEVNDTHIDDQKFGTPFDILRFAAAGATKQLSQLLELEALTGDVTIRVRTPTDSAIVELVDPRKIAEVTKAIEDQGFTADAAAGKVINLADGTTVYTQANSKLLPAVGALNTAYGAAVALINAQTEAGINDAEKKKTLVEATKDAGISQDALNLALDNGADASELLGLSADELRQRLTGVAGAQIALEANLKKFAKRLEELKGKFKEVVGSLQLSSKAQEIAKKRQDAYTKGIDDQKQALDKRKTALEAEKTATEKSVEAQLAAIQKLNDAETQRVDDLIALEQTAREVFSTFVGQIDAFQNALSDAASKAADRLQKSKDEAQKAIDEIQKKLDAETDSNLIKSLTAQLDEAQKKLESLPEAADATLKDLNDVITKNLTETANFVANLNTLIGRGATDLAAFLASQGKGAAAALAEAVGLSNDALAAQEKFVDDSKIQNSAQKKEVDDLVNFFDGVDVPDLNLIPEPDKDAVSAQFDAAIGGIDKIIAQLDAQAQAAQAIDASAGTDDFLNALDTQESKASQFFDDLASLRDNDLNNLADFFLEQGLEGAGALRALVLAHQAELDANQGKNNEQLAQQDLLAKDLKAKYDALLKEADTFAADFAATGARAGENFRLDLITSLNPQELVELIGKLQTSTGLAAADLQKVVLSATGVDLAGVSSKDVAETVRLAFGGQLSNVFDAIKKLGIETVEQIFTQPHLKFLGPNSGVGSEFLMAEGGVFSTPTRAVIGEAGPEVLLPLSNPNRALELAKQSGLFAVLAKASGFGMNFGANGMQVGSAGSTQTEATNITIAQLIVQVTPPAGTRDAATFGASVATATANRLKAIAAIRAS